MSNKNKNNVSSTTSAPIPAPVIPSPVIPAPTAEKTEKTAIERLKEKQAEMAKVEAEAKAEIDAILAEKANLEKRLADINSTLASLGLGERRGRPVMTEAEKLAAKAKRDASKPATPEEIAAKAEIEATKAILNAPAPVAIAA